MLVSGGKVVGHAFSTRTRSRISWSSVALVALTCRQLYRCHAACTPHCSEAHRHESTACGDRSNGGGRQQNNAIVVVGDQSRQSQRQAKRAPASGWRGPPRSGPDRGAALPRIGCARGRDRTRNESRKTSADRIAIIALDGITLVPENPQSFPSVHCLARTVPFKPNLKKFRD